MKHNIKNGGGSEKCANQAFHTLRSATNKILQFSNSTPPTGTKDVHITSYLQPQKKKSQIGPNGAMHKM